MKKLIFFLCICFQNTAISQLVYQDQIFDENIKTVLIYANNKEDRSEKKSLSVPIYTLNSSASLLIEFDDLTDESRQFKAKIISCNTEWKSSGLRDLDFLNEYNEFFVNDYQHSQGTKVQYGHYKFELPKPKLAGNYLVQIYDGLDDSKILISRRFYVLDPKIGITAIAKNSQDPLLFRTHQQLDFSISYKNLQIRNPKEELVLLIRQNYRDDKILKGLKPSSVNFSNSLLNFQFFNNENVFSGLNEFRFFNVSSTYFRGQFVDRVVSGSNIDKVYLKTQFDRSQKAYLETFDNDGRYYIKGIDAIDANVEADYVIVNFALKPNDTELNEDVYLYGQLTDWKLNDENRLILDSSTNLYTCEKTLKQGIYDYIFVAKNKNSESFNEVLFEGEHSETQNAYEIFVYYKSPGDRNDKLIGYQIIKNSRMSR